MCEKKFKTLQKQDSKKRIDAIYFLLAARRIFYFPRDWWLHVNFAFFRNFTIFSPFFAIIYYFAIFRIYCFRNFTQFNISQFFALNVFAIFRNIIYHFAIFRIYIFRNFSQIHLFRYFSQFPIFFAIFRNHFPIFLQFFVISPIKWERFIFI